MCGEQYGEDVASSLGFEDWVQYSWSGSVRLVRDDDKDNDKEQQLLLIVLEYPQR